MRGEPLGEQGAAGGDVDQSRQGGRLFVEQGQVARPSTDGLQQGQSAWQGGVGPVTVCRCFHQRRQDMVQALPGPLGECANRRRTGKIAQPRVVRLGVDEACVLQHGGIAMLGQALPVAGNQAGFDPSAARLQQSLEDLRDHGAVPVQFQLHRRRVGEAQSAGHPRLGQRLDRHGVGLLVAKHLHAVLEPAQETVGRCQLHRRIGGQVACGVQGGQCRQ